MEWYAQYLKQIGFKVPPLVYFALVLVVSLAIAVVLGFITAPVLSAILRNPALTPVIVSIATIIPVLVFIVLIDLLIAHPYAKGLARIDEIEGHLPDALRQMADTLKAGGTYELALRDVSQGEYGALKDEFNLILRKLEEGESFENALRSFPENVNSRLVARTVNIIIDSIKAGAGLADVLEDISEDVREAKRVNTERKTRTLMQTLFMFATGAVVAPFIFGVVSGLISLFIRSAVGFEISQAAIVKAIAAGGHIVLMLQAYIFIEIFASSLMIALMREGKASKSLTLFPVLLLIAFVIFFGSRIMSTLMLAGG